MKLNWKRMIDVVLLFALLGIDQLTKYLAETHLSGGRDIILIPDVFRLHYLEGGNSGGAFGLFQGRFLFFFLFAVLMTLLLIFVYCRMPLERKYSPLRYTVIFLCAGAMGNLVDRVVSLIRTGNSYVTDFLYFEWIDFPIFNVADCYISVSCVILAILFFFVYKDDDFDIIIHRKKYLEKKNQEERKDAGKSGIGKDL